MVHQISRLRQFLTIVLVGLAMYLLGGGNALGQSVSTKESGPATAAGREKWDRFSGLPEVNPPAAPERGTARALVGGTLVDGRGGPPVEDAVVVIRRGRIVAAGSRSSISIPADADVSDVSGMSILPGLIDTHFHIGTGPSRDTIPTLFLSHGVTTARDPGRPIEVYDAIRASHVPMPRCFLTGPHFDQDPPAHPHNAVLIGSANEAREAVDRYVEQGASAIKVYFRLPLDVIEATCNQAHTYGVPVTAHLELVDADAAIRAGLDGIEHITSFGTVLAEPGAAEDFRRSVANNNAAREEGRYQLWAGLNLQQSPRVRPLLDLLVEHSVFVSPTLAVFERRDGDRETQLHHVRGFQNMMAFVGKCHRAGALVVTGSHTWSRHVDLGWAYQREMELLVESGLTPLEAISASTLNGAKFLGCADRLGSIEPGKLADLVLVAGKPHEDIRAMYDVRHVLLNGDWVGDSPNSAGETR